MKTAGLTDPVRFRTGHIAPNRIALAPLTNQLSGSDGKVSADEITWLAMRARGGFGIVSTAAAAVTADGRAFPGQLGIYDESQISGLSRLAAAAKSGGAVAIAQLLHGGPRALTDPVGFGPGTCLRPLAATELRSLKTYFADAAARARQAGFDGVQLHAAYGFLHASLLTCDIATGTTYLRETLEAIRARATDNFILSLRLNLDGYGQNEGSTLALAQTLLADGKLDHLDLVLERAPRAPVRFASGDVVVQLTGNVTDTLSAEALLRCGADVVGIGTGAVLHHDIAARILTDPAFQSLPLPADPSHLAGQGVTGAFLDYLRKWPGFVRDDREAA